MTEPWILTYTGKKIQLQNPDPDLIDIDDIAHALSNIGRFTGHTRTFYSTAQHSVLVASLMPRKLQLLGLLHDASEAFLGDVSSPLKSILPEYQRIEKMWQEMIYIKYGVLREELEEDFIIRDASYSALKEADLISLATEATQLLGDISDWNLPDWAQPLPYTKIIPWTSDFAKYAFLTCFDELRYGGFLPQYQELQGLIGETV